MSVLKNRSGFFRALQMASLPRDISSGSSRCKSPNLIIFFRALATVSLVLGGEVGCFRRLVQRESIALRKSLQPAGVDSGPDIRKHGSDVRGNGHRLEVGKGNGLQEALRQIPLTTTDMVRVGGQKR